MNQQFMQQQQQQQQQQQPGYYAGPHGGAPPYEGLTSNVPQNAMKGPPGGPQGYISQKPVQGPPPSGNLPPPLQSPYYNNNMQGNTQPGPPPSISPHMAPPPTNQSNLTNQMSNMSLGNQQQRPPSASFPPPTGNSNSMQAPPPNVNGFNTPSDHSPSDLGSQNDSHGAQQQPPSVGQTPRQPLNPQGLPSSQQAPSTNSPFTRHSTDSIAQFPGQQPPPPQQQQQLQQPGQQYPGQPPLPGQGGPQQTGMPPSSQQGPPQSGQTNKVGPPSHGQQPMGFPAPGLQRAQPFMGQQNLSGPPMPGQQNLSGPPMPGQQNLSGPPMPGQQNLSGPPMPGQQNLSGPPMPGQQNLSGPPMPGQQNLSGPPKPGLQNLSGPPKPGQQNLSGPPMPGQQNLSGPPMPGQQNLSGPPMPGQQNLSGPPMPGQQNLSGPPMPGQQGFPGPQGFAGPPLPGQQSFAAPPLPGQQNYPGPPPPGQQSLAGPPMPGQQNLAGPPGPGGYQMGGPPGANPQMGGQRQFIPGPPMPGQTVTSPMNRQPPGVAPGYPQPGYPQQSYQPDPYAGQRSPYQQGAMPGAPGGGYQPGAQPQQARRLDPDQMPSPIQVIQDDQRLRGGVFVTNQKGLVPPLVTTKYTTQDQGNASPRFIRSTMYTVPTTNDIMKQTGVPFGLIISPMAQVAEGEYEPPIVDMGEIGPVRCIRCKSYMSPFMQFIDAGRRFQCMFCKATTEVPQEYFQHLDHTGQRMDRYERPELMLGTYEYVATKDYCRNSVFPKPPAIVFLIDVSYNNVKSGLVNLICAEMRKIVRNLPVDAGQTRTSMKVGFITYNNTVHFYNVNACLTQPQMMVVGDVQDVFMPLLDGFLCDAEESEAVIDALMTQIPAMFADTRETETILAPAIQAGLEALKASDRPGKLMVFHSSLPIADAPGKLKTRDDRKVLGTEKEKTVLAPQTNVYNNLGQECVSAGCSVDLFVFNNSYVDIATIGQVCRLTGGEVYKYTYFQADTDGERLITDIVNNISRPIAFDTVMRVRTSTGVRATDFYGHFYMSNTTDMELASIDCNKAVAIEIKHDDKLTDEEGVYIQAALLYTSCGGVRRLRIINLSLRTSSQMAELYRACDLDAVINFFSKQSVFKLIESTPKSVKDGLIARCATILAAYRKYCASPSSAGQLILPECMKLLPLYVNCLLKSDAISGGADMTIDDRSYVMQAVATMPLYTSVIYFYPRLLPLHDIDPQGTDLPQQLRCSFDKFMDDGAYLLENGIHMFLWLGLGLSSEWVSEVFGVMLVDTDRTTLPVLDTPLNKRIRDIVSQVRAERHHCMRLTIVRQREKLEMVLRHFLVEDRGNDSSPSYVDFLCHMHKEIKTLLSQ